MVGNDSGPIGNLGAMSTIWDPERIRRRLLQLETRRRIYERIVSVPGTHATMLNPPFVVELGRELRQFLAGA